MTYRIINLTTNLPLPSSFVVGQDGRARSLFYSELDFPTRIERGSQYRDVFGNQIFENDEVCWTDRNNEVIVDKIVYHDSLGFTFESNCFPITTKSKLQILNKKNESK